MTFDMSDMADSMGVANGWRVLAQSTQGNSCSCHCGHQQYSRRSLVEGDPQELFGVDEKTAPPVIGGL